MQLKYRGVNYDYHPPQVAAKPTGIVGTYRGMEWRFRAVPPDAIQQPTLDLVYRGVSYQTGQPSPIPAVEVSKPQVVKASKAGSSVKDMARALMLGHHAVIKRRQQSMLGRIASEVGLQEGASQYWSHIQGKVHPGFRASYDRSHAALS